MAMTEKAADNRARAGAVGVEAAINKRRSSSGKQGNNNGRQQ